MITLFRIFIEFWSKSEEEQRYLCSPSGFNLFYLLFLLTMRWLTKSGGACFIKS